MMFAASSSGDDTAVRTFDPCAPVTVAAASDASDAQRASGGPGIGIGAGEALRHAEGADAQSWRVTESGDGFIGQGRREVVEFGVVSGVLKGQNGHGDLLRQTGS